jgi:hypothetical protein
VARRAPASAPALLPGPSAQAEFRRFLLKGVGVVVAVLLIVDTAPHVGLGSAGVSIVVLAAGLAALWLILQLFAQVGDRNLEELAHGYTTLTLRFGGFWGGEGQRRPGMGRRAPWDYSGVGAVRSVPDPEREPPGFYPSPNRPGALELWTGAVWAGRYRDA